jgi:hypothetical protein
MPAGKCCASLRARDLKSLGSNFPCRFKSGRPHHKIDDLAGIALTVLQVFTSVEPGYVGRIFWDSKISGKT